MKSKDRESKTSMPRFSATTPAASSTASAARTSASTGWPTPTGAANTAASTATPGRRRRHERGRRDEGGEKREERGVWGPKGAARSKMPGVLPPSRRSVNAACPSPSAVSLLSSLYSPILARKCTRSARLADERGQFVFAGDSADESVWYSVCTHTESSDRPELGPRRGPWKNQLLESSVLTVASPPNN